MRSFVFDPLRVLLQRQLSEVLVCGDRRLLHVCVPNIPLRLYDCSVIPCPTNYIQTTPLWISLCSAKFSAQVRDRSSPEPLSWHSGNPLCSRECRHHHCHHQLPLRWRWPRCLPLCVSQGGYCQDKWRGSNNSTVSHVSPAVFPQQLKLQDLYMFVLVYIHFADKPDLHLAVVTLVKH